jgi:predicted ATPase/class 3 adenylate cyclase
VGVGAWSGTVTFLFTDIEGSTRLWQQDEDAMRAAVARHDELLRHVVAAHGGEVFSTMGDGLAAAFPSASSAVAAAQAAQDALAAALWPTATPIRVRMGLHTGEAEEREGDYFGTAVNRAARLTGVGHGGQVLCSAATAGLVEAEVSLIDLGEHRLRDLDRSMHIFQVGGGKFPPLRSLDVLPGNLPGQPTRFVGRVEELARIVAGLEQSRLVTLTGVGGVGKTRLALQVAAEVLPAFPDGAWVVELAGLIDARLVADTVATVLGVQVPAGGSVEDSLAEAFSAREMLVVLDNCEHVIGSAASLTLRLISSPGRARVLTTSREGLGVPGERVIAVPPLAVPPVDIPAVVLGSDAVQLFVERAADARDGFTVGDADAPTLARLCRRLDGIPLAIELAASRVRSSAPADILAHLDQRFRLLSTGRRTAPTRQQTLRNAIDWSYELLGEPERRLLRRLSVFAGGFDLTAVEAICTDATLDVMDVVDLLDRLVDKSLVTLDLSGSATRYRLLESIRDYAWERLGEAMETDAFAGRHAGYFAELVERAGAGLRGPDEGAWSQLVAVELENLRVALAWAIDNDEADLALRLVGGLAVPGYPVSCPFGDTALGAAAMERALGHPLRPLALSSGAWTAYQRGELDRAVQLADEAHRLARAAVDLDDRRRALGDVLPVLGSIYAFRPGLDRIVGVLQEFRALADEVDDDFLLVRVLNLRAGILVDPEAAGEALRVARILANPTMLSYSLSIRSLLLSGSEPASALPLLEEAAQIAAGVGNREAAAMAQQARANTLDDLGKHLGAAQMRLASAEQLFASGDRTYACVNLFGVAADLHALGDSETALILGTWLVRLMGATPDEENRTGVYSHIDHFLALLVQLPPEELARVEPQVACMTDADALALARGRIHHQELLAGIGEGDPAEHPYKA